MGQAAAKQGDKVTGTDIHIVMIPSPSGQIPTPLPNSFSGKLDDQLSADVNVEGKPAAVEGSTATNSPSHVPSGGSFQSTPADKGTVKTGSSTVLINGKGAARSGDPVTTCNDPSDAPVGSIVASGKVLVG